MTGSALASHPNFRVPDDLVEYDQWVLWRREARGDKTTKVPYQASGKRADSTNPATWTTFEDATDTWLRNGRRYAGVGFVFTKNVGLVGIDLDNALDTEGEVKVWARGLVERFSDTYMEISPSGRGLKIWARGSLPTNLGGASVGDGSIELYDLKLLGHIILREPEAFPPLGQLAWQIRWLCEGIVA